MDAKLKDRLWQIYKSFGNEAVSMNHYDLEEESAAMDASIPASTWKQFLNEPDVIDWINSELNIVQKTELGKMLKDVGSSHSVGQAQIINALSKMDTGTVKQSGPIFIYTYVPLSPEQAQAENVCKEKTDIFLKEQSDDN
jgi:hypothetical protein